MITVYSDNKEIPVNRVEFSDGCLNFKVTGLPEEPEYIALTVDPSTKGSCVTEEISLVLDAILSNDYVKFYNTDFILNLPYLYNARADRRFEEGSSFPLLNFLGYLRDELGIIFDKILCCDIHNLHAIKAFKGDLNIEEKSQLECFKESLSFDTVKDWDVLVAPDKGAVEKAKTIAEYLDIPCVFANKVRDVSTGKLTEMHLPEYDFTGKKVLIPDDIFDFGGTLKWLGELLKEAGASEVELYVTHLIAPKGINHLTGIIDKLYCFQTVGGYINKQTVSEFNLGK